MEQIGIILSLHRPYQKPLKSVKWVCSFVARTQNRNIKPSTFYSEFFFDFIALLKHEYVNSPIEIDLDGAIPSKESIFVIVEFFSHIKKKDRDAKLKLILSDRKTDIDKKIYSTYKTISYYINLAKDKLGFIDEKYRLTDYGYALLKIKSSFFKLNKSERLVIFERLFNADFTMLISKCLYEGIQRKNDLYISNLHIKFIEDIYNIKYFKYTQVSLLANYDNVRSSWIDQLEILDKYFRIRKQYLEIILNNDLYSQRYIEIQQRFTAFTRDILKNENKNHKLMKALNQMYNVAIKNGIDDLGFVNLHYIRNEMKMSVTRFEKLLAEFYESNRRERMILFSNTVSSIDKGQRFYIKGKPVIKIKIF